MTTTYLRNHLRWFISKPKHQSKLIHVSIDHDYSIEPLGTMTVQEFKAMSKNCGGQYITQPL